MTKRLTLTYLVFAIFVHIAYGQTISSHLISTTGNFSSLSGYSLAYSIGETAVVTLYSQNHYLTQGFEQTYPDPFITNPIPNSISVYPNPCFDYFFVYFYQSEPCSFAIDIYDLSGKISDRLNYADVLYGEKEKIKLDKVPKGLYMVHIYSLDGKISKVYKVEKI